MYLPPHFAQTDIEASYRLIEESPLGILITQSSGGIEANHLPFLLDRTQESVRLLCHVARANPVWQQMQSDVDCLVIFQGASTYISPSLYPSKNDTHRVVPTYNYAAVHITGKIIVHDDMKWLRAQAGRLTQQLETSREVPWKMGGAPHDFINEQLARIVGLEIRIAGLQAKWKMSQNRSDVDRQGVVTGLQSGDDQSKAVSHIVQSLMETPHFETK
ncbi:FMN-binding negative transcriptional regulator [Oxalicibacterium solurbis]|uniref:Transcriptional regulator n=1 Tax=Oxalicibacterium solurbis TaxID=69280 RepID=A0A8J3AXQ5_9BURK|nr:FMN-binding negative transcriptional regulator [Oxalicibacterium solurbis]GGI53436.1 transcriptional regulator [Oxalicibacterium solurbis]